MNKDLVDALAACLDELDTWNISYTERKNGVLEYSPAEKLGLAALATAISRPWIDDSDPQKALAESSRPPANRSLKEKWEAQQESSSLPPSRADLGGDRPDESKDGQR